MKLKFRIDAFLVGSLVFWFVLLVLVATFPKADLHLRVNELNSPFFDQFFKYVTLLGDGMFAIVIAILLMFKKLRYGVFVIASYLGSGIFVQLGKRFLFANQPRPSAYFKGVEDLHFVEGVSLHASRSFPSGHSATAFALFACLALLSDKQSHKFLLFVLAMVVAFSRVYLSQHFLLDILVGSFIGTVFTYLLFNPFSSSRWVGLDRSIIKKGNKK